jgi:putative ABC transport system ATP-binding protein
MMELIGVTKVYHQGRSGRRTVAQAVHALRGVSLRIDAGEFVSIMGPSGSGKSTLMHLMGALDTPTSGQALFQGRDLRALSDRERSLLRRTRIGFVFQFFNLLPTLSAAENVALPLLLGGKARSEALREAAGALDRVGLRQRAEHYPDELSGGEMQRVAVARALVGDPDAVLCDEPTGNLDSATSKEVLALLRSLPESGRRSVVMVTHDAQAAGYADRIVRIRDGLIVDDAPVEGRATAQADGIGTRPTLARERDELLS